MQELTTEQQQPTNGTQPEPEWIEDEDEEAMRAALFDQGFDDRPEILVAVPEWHRQVLIKQITGTQRAAFMDWQNAAQRDTKQLQYYMVSNFCLHPKKRKPFLKAGDQQAFMDSHNGAVIETLSFTVGQFCKLDGTTMEQARKNLGAVNDTATTN